MWQGVVREQLFPLALRQGIVNEQLLPLALWQYIASGQLLPATLQQDFALHYLSVSMAMNYLYDKSKKIFEMYKKQMKIIFVIIVSD